MSTHYTAEQIWDACVEVMRRADGPVEVKHVAEAAGCSENEIIATLIQQSGARGATVTFRYPPIPRAAIIAMEDRS